MRIGIGVVRCEPQLFGNAEINVTGRARRQQCRIAGQHRGNLHLLLRIISVNQGEPRWRRDQKANLLRRPKDELVG
jgi:hypothetical protein